jgi:hypothetical protein
MSHVVMWGRRIAAPLIAAGESKRPLRTFTGGCSGECP